MDVLEFMSANRGAGCANSTTAVTDKVIEAIIVTSASQFEYINDLAGNDIRSELIKGSVGGDVDATTILRRENGKQIGNYKHTTGGSNYIVSDKTAE